jgi:hypothetical protein
MSEPASNLAAELKKMNLVEVATSSITKEQEASGTLQHPMI